MPRPRHSRSTPCCGPIRLCHRLCPAVSLRSRARWLVAVATSRPAMSQPTPPPPPPPPPTSRHKDTLSRRCYAVSQGAVALYGSRVVPYCDTRDCPQPRYKPLYCDSRPAARPCARAHCRLPHAQAGCVVGPCRAWPCAPMCACVTIQFVVS